MGPYVAEKFFPPQVKYASLTSVTGIVIFLLPSKVVAVLETAVPKPMVLPVDNLSAALAFN